MRVEIKNVANGRPSLCCIRADGTSTWSRTHPFVPVHDLTHLAVESLLGFEQAFFGLVRDGWEIDDFAAPGAASRVPGEALLAECIVGLLDLERGGSPAPDLPTFNQALAASIGSLERDVPVRTLVADELAAIRALRERLTARWEGCAAGETLVLSFPLAPDEPG